MNMFKAVIWDLDGTLLYTLEDLADASNFALQKHGYQPISLTQTRARIGNGIGNLIALSIPGGHDNPDLPLIRRDFSEYYLKHCLDKTVPYPGIPELVRELKEKGIKNAIVSNKIDSAVHLIDEHYFPSLMDAAIGEQDNVKRKPDPQSVYNALKVLGVDCSEAVYIGDSDVDVATAEASGLDMITVLWGFRDKEELIEAGADCFAGDADELRSILCRKMTI